VHEVIHRLMTLGGQQNSTGGTALKLPNYKFSNESRLSHAWRALNKVQRQCAPCLFQCCLLIAIQPFIRIIFSQMIARRTQVPARGIQHAQQLLMIAQRPQSLRVSPAETFSTNEISGLESCIR
jgi:hypothetical protein